ncbi:MAG TPA: Smr/MutS family protein [Chitinophagales bacterium]|nr:Smr/MutS family protein [Chitinophagales bacterium]
MARKKKTGSIDTEMLRHFMLGGTDFKDDDRQHKSKGEIDLHLDETAKEFDLISDREKLNAQLKHLEKQIDAALAGGCAKLEVIHGKGDGRLKETVHAFLKKHPHVKSFRVMNDKPHEEGATEVFFK